MTASGAASEPGGPALDLYDIAFLACGPAPRRRHGRRRPHPVADGSACTPPATWPRRSSPAGTRWRPPSSTPWDPSVTAPSTPSAGGCSTTTDCSTSAGGCTARGCWAAPAASVRLLHGDRPAPRGHARGATACCTPSASSRRTGDPEAVAGRRCRVRAGMSDQRLRAEIFDPPSTAPRHRRRSGSTVARHRPQRSASWPPTAPVVPRPPRGAFALFTDGGGGA